MMLEASTSKVKSSAAYLHVAFWYKLFSLFAVQVTKYTLKSN